MKNVLAKHVNFVPPALREVSILVNDVSPDIGGINLGQGVCLLPTPELVRKAACDAIAKGENKYCPAHGIDDLRLALSARFKKFNKADYSHDNIVITSGATGAFESVCQALIEEGDEVITFRPSYPYHTNTLERAKANIKYLELTGDNWEFSLSDLEKAVSKRTKFILVCTPNNPTGKVFSRDELETLADFCKSHDILCVTDEVYEYMTYDGREHISMASLPGMFERTITMGSYSKTFSITGWRVGYLAAPEGLVAPLRAMSDQVYVCAPTPFQHAVAKGINELPDSYYEEFLADFTRKRDIIGKGLEKAGLSGLAPQGSYYYFVSTKERFPGKSSESVVKDMIDQIGVGAVPASDFLGREIRGDADKSTFLRFCYAVTDEVLEDAAERLARW